MFYDVVSGCKPECVCQFRIVGLNGVRWVEGTARLDLDDDGQVRGVSGTIHDITERKQAIETLEAALSREKELGDLKSRFVSMASHELRTPLATINSSAELLEMFHTGWTEEKILKHLHRIKGKVASMTQLLEKVLLFGKADEGHLRFNPEPTDLGAFLYDLIEDLRAGLGAQHEIIMDCPLDHHLIEADGNLLHLILDNFLSNAVKYAPAGTTITLQGRIEHDRISLEVRDQGSGIPEADLEHLFEPFHRAANVGATRGTGLGLAIAQRAATSHQGSIEVESTLGEGSAFTLYIPFVLSENPPA